MNKEELLMRMVETVGTVRRDSSEKNKTNKQKKKGFPEGEPEDSPKFLKKMSPLAESTLCLLLREGSMNQSSIARKMNVSGQAISELMKKFDSRGLINRTSGEFNNANIITLTEEGEEKAKEYSAKVKEIAENLFSDFSDEELSIFTILLNKMKKNADVGQVD